MAQRRLHGKVLIATHNSGKLVEMRDLLAPFGLQAVSAAELSLPEPEETGVSFAENAAIKARAASEATGLPAFADDSGICIEALGGEPGIYSARWAGPEKDFDRAMRHIEELLQANGAVAPDQRKAWFVSALTVAWPDGHLAEVEGRVDGTLVWPPRGPAGFGYDPLFLPEGHTASFAELGDAVKNAISHRARAWTQLAEWMRRIR